MESMHAVAHSEEKIDTIIQGVLSNENIDFIINGVLGSKKSEALKKMRQLTRNEMTELLLNLLVRDDDRHKDFFKEVGKEMVHEFKKSMLLVAAAQGFTGQVEEIVKENGELLNSRLDDAGNTALIVAVKEGRYETAQLLLQYGADVDIQNTYSDTALVYAIMANNTDMVKLLLTYEANVNTKSFMGTTPLMWAAKVGDVGIIDLLLQAGADINAVNAKGENAEDIARRNKNKKAAAFLAQKAKEKRGGRASSRTVGKA